MLSCLFYKDTSPLSGQPRNGRDSRSQRIRCECCCGLRLPQVSPVPPCPFS